MASSPDPPRILTSLPSPPQMTSLPPSPEIRSLPPRPAITSLPAVPVRTSLPGVPTMVARRALQKAVDFAAGEVVVGSGAVVVGFGVPAASLAQIANTRNSRVGAPVSGGLYTEACQRLGVAPESVTKIPAKPVGTPSCR